MANIAEQIVDMLVKAGVKRIYAVTGDSLNKINDAVRKDGQGSSGFTYVTKKPGLLLPEQKPSFTASLACCAGSSGPGHVHLINGSMTPTVQGLLS